jgi:ornithine cyclodeaminase/alanine dehydrogenase-like protein (mu-crystallin family)
MKLDGCDILFLNRKEIAGLLNWGKIVETCDLVFQWIGEEKVEQHHITPLRYYVKETQAFALPFPAYVKPLKVIGNKWGGGSISNHKKGLPWFTAQITLNDAETLLPIAIMDGTEITAARTGGHAAIGAKYLARKNSEILAVIGCGVEGRSHLFAISELFDLKEVKAFDVDELKTKEYSEKMRNQLGLRVHPCVSPKEAVESADIVCMCTNSMKVVVMDHWIKPGCHVAATRAFLDLDPKFSETADKWVLGNWKIDSDWLDVPPFSQVPDISKDYVYADLTEIVTGKRPGRENKTERTVMSHLGMGALDIAVAHQTYTMALKKGVGTRLKLF